VQPLTAWPPAEQEPLVRKQETVPTPTLGDHTEAVPVWAEGSRTLRVPIPVQAQGFVDIAPPEEQQRIAQTGEPASLQYIGTAFKTYLLFEAGERLLLVDQHAAHERVLFDRYMERYQGETLSQRLLAPQLIRLTARDVAQLEELQPVLTDAGFEAEAFDATSVAVRAIPSILGQNESVRDLLLDVLDECQTAHGKPTAERLRRRVAQMACKHAVKAGDALSQEDVRALLMQMLATGTQPTCPHGRPIVTELTRRELEKRFKRIP
jgi:DNA mismatch repair protein MutL